MNFSEKQALILEDAIKTWGTESQLHMAIGECGEFITLLGKRSQNRDSREDWISEIADVIIMMEQMAHIMGYQSVREAVEFKLNRLKNRLESTTYKGFPLVRI